jgi:hypothetical protein
MAPPDIFFLRFQDAPWSDPCFMSLGRLVALSQRVESHCRSLALHVKMRLAVPSPLKSEEALHAFCEDVWKQTLHANIAYLSRLCGSQAELYKILDEGRIARNEVAHSVALGFEHWAYDESLISEKSARIRELATALARADHLLCTLDSFLSKEPMPTGERYRTYSDRLVTWVCNTDNGDPW